MIQLIETFPTFCNVTGEQALLGVLSQKKLDKNLFQHIHHHGKFLTKTPLKWTQTKFTVEENEHGEEITKEIFDLNIYLSFKDNLHCDEMKCDLKVCLFSMN